MATSVGIFGICMRISKIYEIIYENVAYTWRQVDMNFGSRLSGVTKIEGKFDGRAECVTPGNPPSPGGWVCINLTSLDIPNSSQNITIIYPSQRRSILFLQFLIICLFFKNEYTKNTNGALVSIPGSLSLFFRKKWISFHVLSRIFVLLRFDMYLHLKIFHVLSLAIYKRV